VVVCNTEHSILNINCERHTVKTLVAHATTKTAGVIGLAHRLQDLNIDNLERRACSSITRKTYNLEPSRTI